jgi:hypothetical protein
MPDPMAPEDEKLLSLARAARVRIGAEQGAAVRDESGRNFAGATVELPSLQMSALDLAAAQAAASGASSLEAAVVVGGRKPDLAVIADLGSTVPVWHCDARGQIIGEYRT